MSKAWERTVEVGTWFAVQKPVEGYPEPYHWQCWDKNGTDTDFYIRSREEGEDLIAMLKEIVSSMRTTER